MCFHSKQSQTAQALEHRFKAKVADGISIEPTIYNGFSFPKTPIITRQAPKMKAKIATTVNLKK